METLAEWTQILMVIQIVLCPAWTTTNTVNRWAKCLFVATATTAAGAVSHLSSSNRTTVCSHQTQGRRMQTETASETSVTRMLMEMESRMWRWENTSQMSCHVTPVWLHHPLSLSPPFLSSPSPLSLRTTAAWFQTKTSKTRTAILLETLVTTVPTFPTTTRETLTWTVKGMPVTWTLMETVRTNNLNFNDISSVTTETW